MAQHPPTDILEQRAVALAKERAENTGIWPHSGNRKYIIFCVGHRDDQVRSFLKWALENGVGFKPLRGCYKGKEERSFIINADDYECIVPFISEQQTILLLSDYNRADVPRATLIHLPSGRRENLGLFCQGTAEVKNNFESWTFDPMTGIYYVTTA